MMKLLFIDADGRIADVTMAIEVDDEVDEDDIIATLEGTDVGAILVPTDRVATMPPVPVVRFAEKAIND